MKECITEKLQKEGMVVATKSGSKVSRIKRWLVQRKEPKSI